MQPPDSGPDIEPMCPNCGSTNVEETGENQIMQVPGNITLKEYVCNDCKTRYFPAMESEEKTGREKLIEKWGRKTDHEAWQNRMRQRKQKKYFILKKKD